MNANLIRLAFLILIIGCNNFSGHHVFLDSTPVGSASREISFRRFLSKFQLAELPLIIRPFEDQELFSKLPVIYGSDSLFINTPYKDSSLDKVFAYRILPDTVNSFKVVWMEPAEMSNPVLTTFSKSGKKISEENLTVGQCGSDCCYTCAETITINKNLYIYAADSIKSCECDSMGPLRSSMRKYVISKRGRISSDGKIYLSQVEQKDE